MLIAIGKKLKPAENYTKNPSVEHFSFKLLSPIAFDQI